MRRINGLSAAIIAAAMLFGTSAFADSRPQNETWRDHDRGRVSDRENDRLTLEGRINSLERERDGYRIHLDRSNYSFFVPERYLGNRGRDLRVGVSIRLGGVFRGGSVFVDSVDFPFRSGYGYSDALIRGVVERVDYRRDVLVLRDERTGRFVDVDMRDAGRRNRVDADDLRRGDIVSLSGQWLRGTFVAYRVDSVRSGGYRRY